MLNAITTKLEIDIMQINEVDPAISLAVANNLPAVVVHPQLVTQAMSTRIRRAGRFKILTTIDWPKGDIYGLNKLRGLTREMMELDGYEIMMTGGKTEIENRNEARVLTDFIRKNISPLAEIRFVLGCLTRPEQEVITIASTMKDIQAPALIRTDTHLRAQASKANARVHAVTVAAIRNVCALPLKLSGNIDSVRVLGGCLSLPQPPARFAVNLQQLQQILKDLRQQPNELRELLTSS